jgi:hypothetical protein
MAGILNLVASIAGANSRQTPTNFVALHQPQGESVVGPYQLLEEHPCPG